MNLTKLLTKVVMPGVCILALVLFLLGCTSGKVWVGDATIERAPFYGPIQGGGEYSIRLPEFKLDHEQQVTYRFRGAPDIRAMVFLKFVSQKRWMWRDSQGVSGPTSDAANTKLIDDLRGYFSVTVSEDGKPIIQCSKPLAKMTWSRAGDQPWMLYNSDHDRIKLRGGHEYVVHAEIEPDPSMVGDTGEIVLTGGGWEPPSIGF